MSGIGRGSVRVRLTLVSALVTAVALATAFAALLGIVRADLVDSARSTLDAALESIETDDPATARFEIELDGQLAELGLFNRPADDVASGVLLIDGVNEAQVLLDAASGELLAVLEPITGEPIDGPLGQQIESLLFQVYDPAIDGTPDALDASPILLIGATPLDDVDASIDAVERALWIVGPLLVLLVAATSWWLAGRALRPVHAISARVGEISASDLDQRVPVPSTDDEIRELAVVMNGMLDRVERGAKRTRQFTADASHELRTPLASVRGAAEIISTGRHPVRAQPLAVDIVDDVDRMDRLIDDLLVLARLDEAEPLRHDVVDLSELVGLVAHRARSVEIDVTFDEASERATVSGDPAQLDRAVSNLVDNAVRHARRTVELAVALDGDVAVVTVHDDGDGVAASDRDRIFDRFTRSDTARDRDHGGTGLGLALVRSIVDAHGGSVHVDSAATGGARFEMRLPAS